MKLVVTLAREAIRIFLEQFKIMEIGRDLPAYLTGRQAGVYVTLERLGGEIRGLGGSIRPSQANIAGEIISAAIAAAFYSPGFQPINKAELASCRIIVDIIKDLQPVTASHDINPDQEGILVETVDKRKGVILPGRLENINMIELIGIACRRGGINPQEENYKVFIFKTDRYQEW